MLIAPVPRYVVFIGKALGGLTNVLFQMIILLVVGALFMGIPLNIASFILTLASALMLGFVCVCLGLFIGSKLSSPDAFSLIMSFVMWPMFLTSGALYPISNLPSYLQAVVQLNPMAYGVDLMRGVILGSFTFGFWLDVAVLALAGLAVFFVGQRSFDKMSLG
jgi:ABC-2 type transport system permease protein